MTATAAPREIRPGLRVTFADADTEASGIVNGPPWVYWTGAEVQARIPVACDDGRTLDVAGPNLRSVA